ncbi:MAG TPA: hypothetical protein VFY04_04455 [Solirubrobacterales bacterium]|nr:hypothetical protein [Solirubrobacterales bacterium]
MRPFALAVACYLALAASAGAAPAPPADLSVDGGQETWRSSRVFRLLWSNPPASPAVSAVHYRVKNADGTIVLGPARVPWPTSDIDGIEVPDQPGAYTAEVWLEDAAGQRSGPAAATLRFDDRPPGATTPLTASRWIGRAAFPLPIRLSRPGQVPVSGIRGYAVSIAPETNRPPCAAAGRCAEQEIDLHGGIDADTYLVPELPEGTNYVRAVSVSNSGVASLVSNPVPLQVDKTYPTTTVSGIPSGWTNRPVELTAIAFDGGSGMLNEGDGAEPFTAISVDEATPVTAAGAAVTTTIAVEGTHRIASYARDVAGNVNDGGSTNGIANPSPSRAVVRIDRTAPAASFANVQDPQRPELVRARVADALSGPDGARGWIGLRRRGSGDPFEALPSRPAPAGELHVHWDSEAYAGGEYEFQAIGFDRAGNSAVTRLRADGSPMVLSNPLKQQTTLRLALATASPSRSGAGPASRLSVSFGKTARVQGRLSAGVRALDARQVQIVERFADGAATRVTTVPTGSGGRFSHALPPGPSREVSAVFGGNEMLTGASSGALELAVRAWVRMRASAKVARVGGAPILFAGKIGAAVGTIPPEGKTIELQFRLPGLPWTEFRTIRTDRRGGFRYRYRFSDDDSRGVRFFFRAYAPAQGGWPYEPAGSRPVAVRGR